jgi:hypothetical protein
MAEFGHLNDADAHVPGAMHWLNFHGFAVTQLEWSDLHDRIISAQGHSSPTLPCILLESPQSFTSTMLAQATVCVHVWPRWRVSAADLFSATQMPHLLIVFHFYTPHIEAPGIFTCALIRSILAFSLCTCSEDTASFQLVDCSQVRCAGTKHLPFFLLSLQLVCFLCVV